jgi:hypothetical protein
LVRVQPGEQGTTCKSVESQRAPAEAPSSWYRIWYLEVSRRPSPRRARPCPGRRSATRASTSRWSNLERGQPSPGRTSPAACRRRLRQRDVSESVPWAEPFRHPCGRRGGPQVGRQRRRVERRAESLVAEHDAVWRTVPARGVLSSSASAARGPSVRRPARSSVSSSRRGRTTDAHGDDHRAARYRPSGDRGARCAAAPWRGRRRPCVAPCRPVPLALFRVRRERDECLQ